MNLNRRLPVYLVLDCSESMAGPALEAVNQGVRAMIDQLKCNPYALETAYLSVITFNRDAKQLAPLTEVMKFQLPNLSVRSGSSLGAALQLLIKCLQNEVVRSSPTAKGDYKPLVFLLTDGQPTDDWESAVQLLRRANNPKIANLYAIGCGPDVDPEILREITDIVLLMSDVTPDTFKKFFIWLSASVNSASVKLDTGTAAAFDMPALPSGLEVAKSGLAGKSEDPRQTFLQAICRKTRKPYLMRFALRQRDGCYEAVAAHPIEVYEKDGSAYMPPIHTSRLDGCPPCPFCENPGAGNCECGVLSCIGPNESGPVTCPSCGKTGYYSSEGAGFDVRRSGG